MDKGKTIVQQAMTCLANLCENLTIRDLIANDDLFVKNLIHEILNIDNRNADISTILLTNISKNDKIIKVLDYDFPDLVEKKAFESSNAMNCLVDIFVKGFDRNLNKYANYDYLSYFFADISRFKRGREFFIKQQDYDGVVPISKLLVFTEKYDSKIRREGVASTIKNCLFDLDSHLFLLTDESVNLLPYLLLPIVSSKDTELDEDELFNLPDELQFLPEDKVRDPSVDIIIIHLESLLLLCSTKQIREYLRGKSVYPLIRELHKNVDNEDIADLCERIVQMLMRDEDPENKVERLPEIKHEDDEDYESDGDDQIVEVL